MILNFVYSAATHSRMLTFERFKSHGCYDWAGTISIRKILKNVHARQATKLAMDYNHKDANNGELEMELTAETKLR